jgi:hypothetical protein
MPVAETLSRIRDQVQKRSRAAGLKETVTDPLAPQSGGNQITRISIPIRISLQLAEEMHEARS